MPKFDPDLYERVKTLAQLHKEVFEGKSAKDAGKSLNKVRKEILQIVHRRLCKRKEFTADVFPEIIWPWPYPLFGIVTLGFTEMIMVSSTDPSLTHEVVFYQGGEKEKADVIGIGEFWPGTAALSTDGLVAGMAVLEARVKGSSDPKHHKHQIDVLVVESW